MRRFPLFRVASPELLFGVFQTLVWLLLVLQVSVGVMAPLAHAFSGPPGAYVQ
jgi:hypothetical protein